MTPSARATALLVAAAVAVLAAATAAVFRGVLAWLEHRDEHPVTAPRHDEHPVTVPRHIASARPRVLELAEWAVSALVRWYRTEFTGLKVGLTAELVALAVAVLIGVTA